MSLCTSYVTVEKTNVGIRHKNQIRMFDLRHKYLHT